jgi:hypothetical protein
VVGRNAIPTCELSRKNMRITRETLLKIAQDTAARRTAEDRSLLAAFLCGSLIDPHREPVIGGTADIDLVFIHDLPPPTAREIIRLTEEVHLDIFHRARQEYRNPRHLRLDPKEGFTLYACRILHDPRHFLDFAQASVRAHFFRPDNVLKRARSLAETARQTWFIFQQSPPSAPGPKEMLTYLHAVENAANAIGCLKGPPLPARGFLQEFPARAQAVDQPGLYPGLLGLLGGMHLQGPEMGDWLSQWEQAFTAAWESDPPPPHLHPFRYPYYRRAIESYLASPQPQTALWPLLTTWSAAAAHLPEEHAALAGWQAALQKLGLLAEGFVERIAALDAYLDRIEEILDQWGRARGV